MTRSKAGVVFDPIEAPSRIYEIYEQNLDLMMRLPSGMIVPVFQSLDPVVCERRRDIIFSRLQMDMINRKICTHEARGLTSRQIGELLGMKPRAVDGRKKDIHSQFGSERSNHTSSIISALGCVSIIRKR